MINLKKYYSSFGQDDNRKATNNRKSEKIQKLPRANVFSSTLNTEEIFP